MSDTIKRHDLLEQIRPMVEQLDLDGLKILQEWVQDLKIARMRSYAERGKVPAAGGTVDSREEFKDLLHDWDSQNR